MAGFIYFLSGDDRPMTPDKARKLGLGYAITGNLENSGVNSNSPSGKPGNIFADTMRHEGKRVGYFPEQQTWRKLPNVEGRPEMWVGYWNDAKPGPSDLSRSQMLRGPKLRLADGNEWQIPIVRRFDDASQKWQSELPAYLDYDEQGKPCPGEPLEQYAILWEVTAPIADSMFSRDAGESAGPTEDCIFDAAGTLLQANYVVSFNEMAFIRALQTSDVASIVTIACRYDALVDWMTQDQKKTDQSDESGLNTTDGKAA